MHVVSSEVRLSFAVASTHQSERPLCGSIESCPWSRLMWFTQVAASG